MSDETIFNADQAGEIEVPNPTPPQVILPPEAAEFVGEGKKYKSVEDALKSIPHAQTHIQKLEEDLAKQREELAKSRAMEELLQEFRQQGNTNGVQEFTPPVQQSAPVDINQAVEAALARKEAQRIAEANANVVIGAFKTAYGEQGEAKFVQVAQENGMSVQAFNALATTSPDAVLKLAGLKKGVAPSVPHTTSTVNTTANLNTEQEVSARVPTVGASTKDVLNAWKNAGIKAEKLRNSR